MRAVIGIAVVLLPTITGAQRPAIIRLQSADARLTVEFSDVISIRELSDGRILVTDPSDLQLVVASFRDNSVKQISRKGAGPGEFGTVTRMYPLGADSSLMPDLTQLRWLVLAGDKVVRTIPADDSIIRKAPHALITGTDELGHVLVPQSSRAPDGESETSDKDSATITRLHRGTGRIDTVAKVLERPYLRTIVRNAKGEISMSSGQALRLRVGEQYRLFADGWLAVIRINPFRIDWRAPDGRWTLGAPLPVPVIRMTDREKRASMARSAQSPGSGAPNPFGPLPNQARADEWPDVMPPYTNGEVTSSPGGQVVFRRQPSADVPGIAYYVVDRRGALAGVIELKNNERIVASGVRSVYVVVTDDDGLKRIRRHPWPESLMARP